MLLYFHITRHQAASGQHAITGRVMLLNVIHKMSPVKVFSKSDADMLDIN